MTSSKKPLSRVWFAGHGFLKVPPESIGGKTLYVDRTGKFVNAYGQELKPSIFAIDAKRRPNCHGRYPCLPSYGARTCHTLVWETFVGPRTKGLQIDHLNGNKRDWSLDNLEEVTQKENIKRAKILRCLREAGTDPCTIPYARLKQIFASYELTDPKKRMERELHSHMEK